MNAATVNVETAKYRKEVADEAYQKVDKFYMQLKKTHNSLVKLRKGYNNKMVLLERYKRK